MTSHRRSGTAQISFRWVFNLAIGGIIFACWIISGAAGGGDAGASSTEDAVIRDYVATFTVQADGQLAATEDLAVYFPTSRHGIFRFWDVRDPTDPHVRLVPSDITVSRDGHPEPFTMLQESHGRYRVAKIGDPNELLAAGVHRYRIGYRIQGVLEPGAHARTQLYWDLVPAGWQMRIDRTRLTVHLPAPAHGVDCALGVGSTGGCTARGAGSSTLTVTTGALAPHTPVTLRAGLDIPTPPRVTVPWPQRLDYWLGTSPVVLGLVLALALAAGAAGAMVSLRSREPRPGYPLQYAPPDGIGPAQGVFVAEERVDEQGFVATLMHAAEQRAVGLTREGEGWRVEGRGGSWSRLDEVTRSTLETLIGSPKGDFDVTGKDVFAGQQLQFALSSYKQSVASWARREGYVVKAGLGSAGGIVALVALAGAAALAFFNPLDLAAVALIPGLFGLGALPLVRRGSGTRRTARGRELWSRIGGFRRILATPSSEARFDFSGRQELYTAYVPWAVAFGVADEWAKKYRTETGAEPPAPIYFVGYPGVNTAAFASSMVADFQGTLHSAISSYQATQHSSGGGGGGFSGGGGGGGGGGGSW